MWNNYVGKKLNKEKMSQKEVRANDIVNMFFGKSIEKKSTAIKEPLKGENIETTIELSVKEAFDGAEKKISIASINNKSKNLLLKIPAGIKNGKKIRVAGKGKEGKNGGKNGDLVIEVKIVDSGIYKLVSEEELFKKSYQTSVKTLDSLVFKLACSHVPVHRNAI